MVCEKTFPIALFRCAAPYFSVAFKDKRIERRSLCGRPVLATTIQYSTVRCGVAGWLWCGMGWNDIEVGCAVRCDVDGSIGVVCFDAGRNGV